MINTVGLALALLAVVAGEEPPVAGGERAAQSQPEAAVAAERPPPAAPAAHTPEEQPKSSASLRAAWSVAAITLALVGTGTVFGVLAQQRSDSLNDSTRDHSAGLPPIYDEDQRTNYTSLQSDGQTYEKAALACLFISGATAITSAALFWNASRKKAPEKSLALLPLIAPRGAALTLVGGF